MKKINCAIIGPGNIGLNLMCKIGRSDLLNCAIMIGRNLNSKGLAFAHQRGICVSYASTDALIEEKDRYDIVFDATDAQTHKINSEALRGLGKFIIDLTPSKVGRFCIPCLNKDICITEQNINMVTCGGQSMVPIAYAMTAACRQISYFEVISTIASASAGPGTRSNIDDYMLTTRQALREFTGIEQAKSMIVLNPAVPPVNMKNTLYAVTEEADMHKIKAEVHKMESRLKKYVPGFSIIVEPTRIDNDIIAVTAQVKGTGDYLPEYAGNLDIITCAAVEIAEFYARRTVK